jgi:hypothetical protein
VVVVVMMRVDVVMVVVVRVVSVSVLASVGVCDIHRVGGARIGPSVQRALTFSERRPTSPQNEQQEARRGREGARRQQGRSVQARVPASSCLTTAASGQPSTRQPLPLPLSSDRRLSH